MFSRNTDTNHIQQAQIKTTNRSLDKNWENNKAESYTRYPGKNSNAKKGSR
jgi:hypothetical protein